MAIDFRTVRISFDPTRGQIQSERGTAVFRNDVINAEAAIKGFCIQYSDGDHHLLREEIAISNIARRDRTIIVTCDFLLRDDSGNIDDRYEGWVDVLVIAEVQDPRPRPIPIPDLPFEQAAVVS